MKKYIKVGTCCILIVFFVLLAQPLTAVNGVNDNPTINQPINGKYRIAYCETEPWINYSGTLYALAKGLEKKVGLPLPKV